MKKTFITLLCVSVVVISGMFLVDYLRPGTFPFLTNLTNLFSKKPPTSTPIQTPIKPPPPPEPKPKLEPSLSKHMQVSKTSVRPPLKRKKKNKKKNLRKNFNRHLKKKQKQRLLKVPEMKPQGTETIVIPKLPKPTTPRAIGRKERAKLPLGVVLWDDVPVYSALKGRDTLYSMKTGDFVRIFDAGSENPRLKMQPGVDLYLAATSKQFEAAGNRFPDQPGWVDASNVQVFNPEQAVEFTQKTVPVTLGLDSNFSTVSFYERAMKNPDPVVHRVVGPRIIELLSLHEDYVSTWGSLYRDNDSKIRSVTLSALRKRGVGNNREIVEDLIKRLAELTQGRLRGATEAEAISILNILGGTGHSRVPTALQSFRESWAQNQSQNFMNAVDSILEK